MRLAVLTALALATLPAFGCVSRPGATRTVSSGESKESDPRPQRSVSKRRYGPAYDWIGPPRRSRAKHRRRRTAPSRVAVNREASLDEGSRRRSRAVSWDVAHAGQAGAVSSARAPRGGIAALPIRRGLGSAFGPGPSPQMRAMLRDPAAQRRRIARLTAQAHAESTSHDRSRKGASRGYPVQTQQRATWSSGTSSGGSLPPLDQSRPVKVRGHWRTTKSGKSVYVRPHTRRYPR